MNHLARSIRRPVVGRWFFLAASAGVLALGTSIASANRNAADTTNALGLIPGGPYGYSLTGAGVRVGIFEAGGVVRATHQEFQLPGGGSIVTVVDTGSGITSHGTSVAGVIAGNGVGGSQYRGMAPDVRIRSYSSGSANTKINRDAALLDITNHSYSTGAPADAWETRTWTIPGVGDKSYETWNYGTTQYRNIYESDPVFGRYTSSSVSTDQTLYNNPRVVSFYSAGNTRGSQFKNNAGDGKYVARFSPGFAPVGGVSLGSNYWLVSTASYPAPGVNGYDTLAAFGTTKNNVVVGSISDYLVDPHPFAAAATISSFTNWGPTDDGRLGVTIVANGASLATATSASNTSYTSGISGTSFSSPNAAGTQALILQHWRNQTNGYTPYSATQKALLIHTATDVVVGGQVGPDYRTGYGIINAHDAVRFIDDATQADPDLRTAHIIESTINRGQSLSFDFTYTGDRDFDGDGRTDGVLASLVWTDPAGTANSSSSYNDRNFRALVNDLDLWITDADGAVYYPWTLDPNNPNLAATRNKRNDVDNMEQVWINGGVLSANDLFTIHIGIDGNLVTLAQNFSLLVSGGMIAPVPEPATLACMGIATLLLRRRRA